MLAFCAEHGLTRDHVLVAPPNNPIIPKTDMRRHDWFNLLIDITPCTIEEACEAGYPINELRHNVFRMARVRIEPPEMARGPREMAR